MNKIDNTNKKIIQEESQSAIAPKKIDSKNNPSIIDPSNSKTPIVENVFDDNWYQKHASENFKKNTKWNQELKIFIPELGENLSDQIEEEEELIYKEKEEKKDAKKLKKISGNIFSKIDDLCLVWKNSLIDLTWLNAEEKIKYQSESSLKLFKFIIYIKIHDIISRILLDQPNCLALLEKVSPLAKLWIILMVPNQNLTYELKTQKIKFYFEALANDDFNNVLFALKKGVYKKVIRNEERSKYLFDVKINSYIFNLNNNIKKSFDKKTLFKNTKNNIVDIRNGNMIYASKTNNLYVLKDINLTIEPGEFIFLLGPSGSGKTTLMNIISGIDQLSFGDAVVAGNNITKLVDHSLTKFRLNNISYIFQHYGLLPNLTVEENIMMGDYLKNKDYTWKNKAMNDFKDKEFIESLLINLELTSERKKMVYELSGGQQQRVSIARAIAKQPKILFGDEPTSALDSKTADKIMKALKHSSLVNNQTVIIITHNEEVVDYATRIIRLKDGEIISDQKKEK